MSRSKHHGCGRAKCGLCKPHKKWKGQRKKQQPINKVRRKGVDVEDA